MTELWVERAYACHEQGCRKTWLTFHHEPDIRCPFCSSTLITFECRPEPEERKAA